MVCSGTIRAAFCVCVVPWFAVGLSEQHSVSVYFHGLQCDYQSSILCLCSSMVCSVTIRAAFCVCVGPWFAVGVSEQHSVSV